MTHLPVRTEPYFDL